MKSKNIRYPGTSIQYQPILATLLIESGQLPQVFYATLGYSRVLGLIYIEGKNINLEMVRAGFAEAYKGKPPKGFDPAPYQKAETKAQSDGKGMWSLGKKYISPQKWREMKREK